MTTLTQYLVPCITEGINVSTDFMLTFPLYCPHSTLHTIDSAGIIAINVISPNQVVINQDSAVATNHHYMADHHVLSIPGGIGATAGYDVTYDYNISAYTLTILGDTNNIGDTIDVIARPNTVFNTITAGLLVGALTLILPDVVGLYPGYDLSITDGVNTDNLGHIVSVDLSLNIVTFSIPTLNTFAIGSSVIYSIPKVRGCKITNGQNITFGEKVFGTAGLAAGQIARVIYTNSTVGAKTLNFRLEFQF